jgi:hypothetical protein
MAVTQTHTARGHIHQIMEELPRVNAQVTDGTPTAAELTAGIGAQPDGYACILDDNGAGTAVYLVVRKAGTWWYEALTAAS